MSDYIDVHETPEQIRETDKCLSCSTTLIAVVAILLVVTVIIISFI